MSKVKCFNCLKFRHFVANCSKGKKRKGKQHASVVDVEDDQPQKKARESQLDEMAKSIKEYYLISALSSSITSNSEIWLVAMVLLDI